LLAGPLPASPKYDDSNFECGLSVHIVGFAPTGCFARGDARRAEGAKTHADQPVQRPPHLAGTGTQKFDEAVFVAYSWPNELSGQEILEKLLSLNLERAEEG